MTKWQVRCCGRSWFELVVDTGKSYHYYWLCLINLAVFYNLTFVVGRAVFWELNNKFPVMWLLLDYLSDLLYCLDIFIRMHEGYLEQVHWHFTLYNQLMYHRIKSPTNV